MTHRLYDALGVPQNAPKEDIKRAYKVAAMKNHPDKGGDPEVFKEVSNAYAILNDEDQRRRYDQLGDEGWAATNGGTGGPGGPGGPGGGMDPNDIFQQFFGGGGGGGGGGFHGFPGGGHPFEAFFGGGRPRGPPTRADHVHPLKISLREAYFGVNKSIRVNVQKTCFSCLQTCETCQGQGVLTNMVRGPMGAQIFQQPCQACQAKGKRVKPGNHGCHTCKGGGTYKEERRVELEFPRGVSTGARTLVEGCGEQPQSPGERPGNLLIDVVVDDNGNSNSDGGLRREGDNLVYVREMPWIDSVCGHEFIIDHFDSPVRIDTADWGVLDPARRYIVPGKGMPKKDSAAFGDLLVTAKIAFPSNLSPSVRANVRAAASG